MNPEPIRIPPCDLDAEQSVLGALMINRSAVQRVQPIVRPEDFYRENHGQIYRAALSLELEGAGIDNVTLAARLDEMGVLEQVGGRAHLAKLREDTPTAANVEDYARIVARKAWQRRLIQTANDVAEQGGAPGLDEDELATLQERLARATSHAGADGSEELAKPAGSAATFPDSALPRPLCNLAASAAAAFGYPMEFVAVPGLSVLAAAVGGSHALQVMGGWVVRPIIWTVVIAPPGSSKSPAQNLVMKPLKALNSEWYEEHLRDVEEWELECAQLKKLDARPPEPVRRRCSVGDTNVSMLPSVIRQNDGRGLVWVCNELAAILGGLDQFGRGGGSDRPRFLQLWDGDPWEFDRVMRGSFLIRHPLVSVLGGLVPDRVGLLSAGDGLGSRFLRTYHPAAGLAVGDPDHPIEPDMEGEWDELVRSLIDQQADVAEPRIVTMRPDAQKVWVSFQAELRELYSSGATSSFGQEVIAKANLQMHRLSLVLHCAGHPDQVPSMIRPETVEAAAALTRYFVGQTLASEPDEPSAAADRQTRDLDEGVQKLVRWLQRRRNQDGTPSAWATGREIHRAKIAGLKTPDEVARVLDRYGQIHPRCVIVGRPPGVTTGPVGRLVYLPGAQPEGAAE